MNIAIVNDMMMAVEVLRRVVTSVPGYQVPWIARDGAEAVKKCALQRPDLILMDLLMPVMDGVEATRQIMAASPCAILVVTATVMGNSAKVYEAMGHGALDAVNTPVLEEGLHSPGAEALLAKIKIVGRLVRRRSVHLPPPSAKGKIARPAVGAGRFPALLVIGASTGGPAAVSTILSKLPADFPAAVVVIQHIDQVFADGFAAWLSERSALPVRVAVENAAPAMGSVAVAATNDHLALSPDLRFVYTADPEELAYRPSVDVFLESIPPLPAHSVVGVLLTGIGRDGAQGMLKLRRAGHYTIVQNEQTSVVYGMPRAAVELNAASQVLPIDGIADSILERFRAGAVLLQKERA